MAQFIKKNGLMIALLICLPIFNRMDLIAADGRVKVSETHQTMEGFGASVAFYVNWLTNHPNRVDIYDLVCNDLGLDIIRLQNVYRGSGGDFDPDAKQIVEQMNAIALVPPLVMLSSWSPPGNLKSNGVPENGGTLIKENGKYVYGAFAQYWVDALNAYAAEGVIPDYIGIQNEPDWTASWASCLFDGLENSTNAGYNRALDTVYFALQQMSSPPKIMGPEVLGIGYNHFQNYANQFNHAHMDAYAYHLYHGESDNKNDNHNPDLFIPNLSGIAASYPGKPIFQTEYDRGGWFNTVWLIHNCLVYGNVSAYLYWELTWDMGAGTAMIGLENPWNQSGWTTPGGYVLTNYYYGLRQYSKYIDAGWKRVTTEVDVDSLRMSAFISPDGDYLTVVILNIARLPRTMAVDIQDFNVIDGIIVRTSDTEQGVTINGSYDGKAATEFPARTISTMAFAGTSTNKVKEAPYKPAEFSLYQNYPNPFNPVTDIDYSITSQSYVQIKVYDVLGREVATLVNEKMPAGRHTVHFEANNLNSGVYLYQLKAGNFIQTKKMILIK
ncbi:MAG: T9SS type A sorting domain-containing protein [Bacteroidota bacterium]